MATATVELIKEINIPGEKCTHEMTGDKAKTFYTETDKKGNKFEIKCDGQLLGVFTRAVDGTEIYVGKCIYPWGHNKIRKKVLATAEVKVRADGKIGWTLGPNDPNYVTPDEMETITWKNIKPEGDPPKTGKKGDKGPEITGAKDILWIYDVKTNTYVTQKTENKGNWIKDGEGDDDWIWEVSEQIKDGKESAPQQAPKDRKDLSVAGVNTEHGRGFCAIGPPDRYVAYTPAPFTVTIDDQPHTYVARLPLGAKEFEFESIWAVVDRPFTLQVIMPHEEEQVLTFSMRSAPAGMSVGTTTGILKWTPNAAQIGNHKIIVKHAYAGLTSHEDQFVLSVKPSAG
jgi:hypothetical protein